MIWRAESFHWLYGIGNAIFVAIQHARFKILSKSCNLHKHREKLVAAMELGIPEIMCLKVHAETIGMLRTW